MLKKLTKSVDPEISELAERLRQAVGNFVRAVRHSADTPTTAQSETLALLEREGAMSVASLASRRNVKHQSMRLVVAQLEREGLTERYSNADDRRSRTIALTQTGRKTLKYAGTERVTSIASLLQAQLSNEERDVLRKAVTLLERISTT